MRGHDAELRELDGEPGHVHLLVNIAPMIAISRQISSFKGLSSRRLRHEFLDLHRHN